MKAIVFADGKLSLDARHPMPARRPGEALIRVLIAGICSTDAQIVRGYMEFSGIPGHEFVGVVEEADDALLVGARVVGEINCPCNRCRLCGEGLGRHCRERTVLGILGRDGAFAEYLALPEANLHIVPETVDDETAVFAEPLAAAFAILEQVAPKKGERCLVMGDGKLGLLVAQALAPVCDLTLLGTGPGKIGIARGLGIRAAVTGAFRESEFDIVVEATGNRHGLEGGISYLRPRGTLVLKTTVAGGTPVPIWRLVVDEITVVGSRCGLFEPALAALEKGLVKVKPLISAKFALDDFEQALRKSAEHGTIKVLLYPAGQP